MLDWLDRWVLSQKLRQETKTLQESRDVLEAEANAKLLERNTELEALRARTSELSSKLEVSGKRQIFTAVLMKHLNLLIEFQLLFNLFNRRNHKPGEPQPPAAGVLPHSGYPTADTHTSLPKRTRWREAASSKAGSPAVCMLLYALHMI